MSCLNETIEIFFKQNPVFQRISRRLKFHVAKWNRNEDNNKPYQYMIKFELLSAWQSLNGPLPIPTPCLPIYYWFRCKWIYHQYDLWNIPPLMISMSSTGITQFVINWAANSVRSKNSSKVAVPMDTGLLITIDISVTGTTSTSLTREFDSVWEIQGTTP